MINTAKFQIIGHIGSTKALDKVLYISITSDHRKKNKDGKWQNETQRNEVTILSPNLRKLLEDNDFAKTGNLLLIEGSIKSNSYMKDDQKIYSTSLIGEEFKILKFTQSEE